jgi:hypothetical protein
MKIYVLANILHLVTAVQYNNKTDELPLFHRLVPYQFTGAEIELYIYIYCNMLAGSIFTMEVYYTHSSIHNS